MTFDQFELLMIDSSSKRTKNIYLNDGSLLTEYSYIFNKHVIFIQFDKKSIHSMKTTLIQNSGLYNDPTMREHINFSQVIEEINQLSNQYFIYINSFGMF